MNIHDATEAAYKRGYEDGRKDAAAANTGRGLKMSESREHKRRYNRRLEYIARFDKWLEAEPPMIRLFAWWKWKKQRPVWED